MGPSKLAHYNTETVLSLDRILWVVQCSRTAKTHNTELLLSAA